jgi:hypothetical protein
MQRSAPVFPTGALLRPHGRLPRAGGLPSSDRHGWHSQCTGLSAAGMMDGFTEVERQVPVDPDSPLGRAMAAARAA